MVQEKGAKWLRWEGDSEFLEEYIKLRVNRENMHDNCIPFTSKILPKKGIEAVHAEECIYPIEIEELIFKPMRNQRIGVIMLNCDKTSFMEIQVILHDHIDVTIGDTKEVLFLTELSVKKAIKGHFMKSSKCAVFIHEKVSRALLCGDRNRALLSHKYSSRSPCLKACRRTSKTRHVSSPCKPRKI